MADFHALPEDRLRLVFRLRRQIAEGGYDSEERLETAVERMFELALATDSDDAN